jgi:hypothetical protein
VTIDVSILDYDILPLDVAQFTQPSAERVGTVHLSVGGRRHKKSYPRDFRWLLRLGYGCNNKQRHYKQDDKRPAFFIAHTIRYVSRRYVSRGR